VEEVVAAGDEIVENCGEEENIPEGVEGSYEIGGGAELGMDLTEVVDGYRLGEEISAEGAEPKGQEPDQGEELGNRTPEENPADEVGEEPVDGIKS
jgi:hypothetical protein